MKDLQIFKNNEFGQVRVITKENETWFVGKDVAEILGYKDTADALKKHVDEADKELIKVGEIPTLKISNFGAYIINESGLYSLVLSSKLPTAKKFKHWVTSEVLPQIRQTGGYIPTDDNDTDEDIMAKALLIAHKKIELKDKALAAKERQLIEQQPKVIFADSVQASKTSILVGELAKIIKQNGHDIGGVRLFSWLREKGYLIKRKGTDYNMPTQKAMELGLFEIKETAISHSDGHISVNKTPKVTGKGQIYFVTKFRESKAM